MNNRRRRTAQIFALILVAAMVIGLFIGFFQMNSLKKEMAILDNPSHIESIQDN